MASGLVIVAALAGTAGTVDASVLRALTLQQLRDGADAIVAGKVVRVRSVRSGGSVETLVRVRVQRAWRGTDQRVVVLRAPGGFVAGRRLVVPGAPTFEQGQRVLLFLEQDGESWRPVGLFQGVWRLDPERPEAAWASPSGGAALIRGAGEAEAAVDRGSRPVRELVGGVGGGR